MLPASTWKPCAGRLGPSALTAGALSAIARSTAKPIVRACGRDIQYILTAVTHELHPHTDFEIRLSDLLAQIEVVRTKRNLLLHSSWTRSTKPGVAHWSKISAKTKAGVKTDRGTISLTEITELAQKAQNICGEILLLHREIGAIW